MMMAAAAGVTASPDHRLLDHFTVAVKHRGNAGRPGDVELPLRLPEAPRQVTFGRGRTHSSGVGLAGRGERQALMRR